MISLFHYFPNVDGWTLQSYVPGVTGLIGQYTYSFGTSEPVRFMATTHYIAGKAINRYSSTGYSASITFGCYKRSLILFYFTRKQHGNLSQNQKWHKPDCTVINQIRIIRMALQSLLKSLEFRWS